MSCFGGSTFAPKGSLRITRLKVCSAWTDRHKLDKPKTIHDFRSAIDALDDEILRLLNDRSQHVIEIGKLKKRVDSDAHLHTPGREAEVVERLMRQNQGPFPSEAIRPVYREIMSASLSLEGPQRVAYLGPRATFTHLACIQKFGESAQYVPVNSITEVFSEVERGRAHFGVVPIENSTEGVVNHTLDMFIDSNLTIGTSTRLAGKRRSSSG